MASRKNPLRVERRRTRDVIALLASGTLTVAVVVLLTHFAFAGPTGSVCGLLAVTLSAESVTVVLHAKRDDERD